MGYTHPWAISFGLITLVLFSGVVTFMAGGPPGLLAAGGLGYCAWGTAYSFKCLLDGDWWPWFIGPFSIWRRRLGASGLPCIPCQADPTIPSRKLFTALTLAERTALDDRISATEVLLPSVFLAIVTCLVLRLIIIAKQAH